MLLLLAPCGGITAFEVYIKPSCLFRSCITAKEMADCLARVVDTSMLLQRALQKATPKRGKGSARQGDGFAMWKAFLRGVHTVAVAPPVASSRVLEVVKMVCSGLGVDVSLDTVSRAAFLLLDELLPLERKEVGYTVNGRRKLF